MKKAFIVPGLISLMLMVCCHNGENNRQAVDFVNPFVGTAAYGHTFPGAALPFGMVQLSPTTGASAEKAGYAYSSVPHNRKSSTILGFTHTNLSGTGFNTLAKYANILFMPTVGQLQLVPGREEAPETGYRSRFSHEREQASPGYYQVILDDYQINAELTATLRAGMHRYTFPETEQANLIIDITRETLRTEYNVDAFIEIAGDRQVSGYTTVIGHASREPMTWYFFAEFNKPFVSSAVFNNSIIVNDHTKTRGNRGVGACVSFSMGEQEQLIAKVGISFTGIEGARKNLETEIDTWDFDRVKQQAEDTWNAQLNKIRVDGGSPVNKTKFYTALYHSLLFPRTFSDADGSYHSHFLKKTITENDFTYYVDFALWDTHRTLHPLFTIIEPERQIDMIKTFLAMYEQGGRIPSQVSFRGFYSPIMIGEHGSTVIFDSFMKGIRDYDVMQAYEGMIRNAFDEDLLGMNRDFGYAPADLVRESVSKTLEDAFVYWGIAQVAKELGKMQDYEVLMQLAGQHQNLYDQETGFYRPRFSDGSWLPVCGRGRPASLDFAENGVMFDCWNEYRIFGSPYRHYTESNAWQYLFHPPHDIQGLINLMGGREKFIERLDGLFYTSSSNLGPWYVGVTGAIGQYVHGNEPSLHMGYLYNYAGAPWKTQERIRGIMETLYTADEWGLPGNDDMGTLSAWYVFSAMGLYPVTPGQPYYAISSPLFEYAEIDLGDYYGHKVFKIIAPKASGDNKYIQSARLNGKPLHRPWVTHEEIVAGGRLEYVMGSDPNKKWGASPEAVPPSMTK